MPYIEVSLFTHVGSASKCLHKYIFGGYSSLAQGHNYGVSGQSVYNDIYTKIKKKVSNKATYMEHQYIGTMCP